MTVAAFVDRRAVRPNEIDDLGHVNNVEYLRWILDAATAHWVWLKACATAPVVGDIAWVVLRHELDYLAPALPGDAIAVHTWVPTCTATTCDRFAEIERVRDHTVLARSASSYCVVDRVTGRPRRLTDEIRVAIGAPTVVKRGRTDRSFPARP